MNREAFWALIDAARASRKATSAALIASLKELPATEIATFDAMFSAYYMAVHREDLWAAVYAVRGGCGDDSFDYFCGWLLSRGHATVETAVRDPESLIEIIGTDSPHDELMLGAARIAYRKATGHELVDDASRVAEAYRSLPDVASWPESRIGAGARWNRAFYEATFPRLFERYFASTPEAPRITHARFWSIIDAARESASSVAEAERALETSLFALATSELIGFERWLMGYWRGLSRRDLDAASRLVFRDDSSAWSMRSWLLYQGEAALRAAVEEVDGVVDGARWPAAKCDIRALAWRALEARDASDPRLSKEDGEEVPNLEAWRPDWPQYRPSPEQLRARFPRLTASWSDRELAGKPDPQGLSSYEREQLALGLFESAMKLTDDDAMLRRVEEAVQIFPESDVILAGRAEVHARMGRLDVALADLDASLARRPDAPHVEWARSKVRLILGDREGAVADARAASRTLAEPREWLAAQIPGSAKRVRHAKFGDGSVVSVDDTGTEPKLVVDFAAGRKTIAARFLDTLE